MIMNSTKKIIGLSLFSLSLALGACGDSDPADTNGTTNSGGLLTQGTPSGQTPSGQIPGNPSSPDSTNTMPDPGQTPVYAILSQIFAPQSQTTYILTTNTLGAQNPPLDVKNGIEVAGRAIGVGIPELGALIIGTGDSPELRRYTLNPQGQLQTPPTVLSLVPYGIAGIGEYQSQFQIISKDKAYFFDGKSAQIAVFNPSTMTLIQSVTLAGLQREGTILTFSPRAIRSGNKLIMPVGWRSADNKQIPSETAVVTVDTTSNVATITTDARCGYARDATVGDDGKIYLFTDAYAAAVHRLNSGAAPKPCVLRFDPMTAAYDANYLVNPDTLTSGVVFGSAVPGPGNTALISVLNEQKAQAAIKPETPARALSANPVWDWWTFNMGDTPSASAMAGATPSNGSQLPLEVGTQIFLPNFAKDRKTTALFELTESGVGKTPAMQAPGLVFSMMKLR